MSKADEFRQYAREAIAMLPLARNREQREIIEDLAKTWLQAAETVNRQQGQHSLYSVSGMLPPA